MMEKREMGTEAIEAAALPPPPGPNDEINAMGAKTLEGSREEQQDASSTQATPAKDGSVLSTPNAKEKNKTKAENNSSTPRSWWRSVFSFCIWSPEESSMNDVGKSNSSGISADRSKSNGSPANGEIKTRVNRLSPHQFISSQSSVTVNGRNLPVNDEDDYDDDGDAKDTSAQTGLQKVSYPQFTCISNHISES